MPIDDNHKYWLAAIRDCSGDDGSGFPGILMRAVPDAIAAELSREHLIRPWFPPVAGNDRWTVTDAGEDELSAQNK